MSAFPAVDVDDDLLVTAHGYQQLCAELEALRTVRRAALTEQLREAREDGDPENPMLFDLLEEQSQLEGRINLLGAQVAAARVVRPAGDGTAGIGSCVRVRHCDSVDVAEYHLVGPIESDVSNGRVSVGAPVGRALIGRLGGETVVVETPRGRQVARDPGRHSGRRTDREGGGVSRSAGSRRQPCTYVARVARGRPELGLHDIFLTDAAEHDPLFAGLARRLQVFGWHEDGFDLAPGALPLAGSISCTYQAFRFGAAAYGLQFHPEVRVDDLARWRSVDGYRTLAMRTGKDFDALTIGLRRATPGLDVLAEQLLDRWLYLVAGIATLALPQTAAA